MVRWLLFWLVGSLCRLCQSCILLMVSDQRIWPDDRSYVPGEESLHLVFDFPHVSALYSKTNLINLMFELKTLIFVQVGSFCRLVFWSSRYLSWAVTHALPVLTLTVSFVPYSCLSIIRSWLHAMYFHPVRLRRRLLIWYLLVIVEQEIDLGHSTGVQCVL